MCATGVVGLLVVEGGERQLAETTEKKIVVLRTLDELGQNRGRGLQVTGGVLCQREIVSLVNERL